MENLNLTPTPLDTSLASASNSSSTADGNIIINHECDVFINHCTHEVGRTFASHLYHSLLSQGLRVFLETEEMQEGDGITSQIEGAIATAPVQIAIFSPCYAKSARCLHELVLMLKRKSSSMILPVFYKVYPTQLRGKFLEKLINKKTFDSQTHQEYPTYDAYTTDEWRKALVCADEINGFVLEDCNNDEGKLVKNIVERVLKKLKNHLCYDVFINHKGSDVKKTLASHIYYALIAHGLRVFLDIEEFFQKKDIEELQQGESLNSQIERAIGTAFVHIAIFSPKYAESKWCLEELVLMLQSTKTIIPVFKGVTPSDLMSQLTKEKMPRYDNETLAKWRDCLSQIALAAGKPHSDGEEGQVLSGFDLGEFEGDEGKLVDHVVKGVLQEEARRF